MNTREQIIDIISGKNGQNRPLTAHELIQLTRKSAVMVHKTLKKLVSDGILQKIGTAPKVLYILN